MDGDLNRNTYFTYKSLFPLSDQESCRAREELAAGACATDGRGHEEGGQQEEPGEWDTGFSKRGFPRKPLFNVFMLISVNFF